MKNKKSKVQNRWKGLEPLPEAISRSLFYPIKLPPTLHVLPLARNPHEERTLLSRSRQAPKLARRVGAAPTTARFGVSLASTVHASALKIGTPDGIWTHDLSIMLTTTVFTAITVCGLDYPLIYSMICLDWTIIVSARLSFVISLRIDIAITR